MGGCNSIFQPEKKAEQTGNNFSLIKQCKQEDSGLKYFLSGKKIKKKKTWLRILYPAILPKKKYFPRQAKTKEMHYKWTCPMGNVKGSSSGKRKVR